MKKPSFAQEKKKLRRYYKRLKARMIEWDDVPEHYQRLLVKYYNVKVKK